jgi:lysophospholipase L1-like esterase
MSGGATVNRKTMAFVTLSVLLATGSVAAKPALEDASGNALSALHAAFRRAERKSGQARLLFYGASHTASDTYTGQLRRLLQARFGDAGHGFVLPAPPWRSYRHSDVNIDGTLTWWADWVGRPGANPDGLYGLAGVSLKSSSAEDYASLSTTIDSPVGRSVGRFELFYLEQPGGGGLEVRIDGRLMGRIQTGGLVPRAAYHTFDLEDEGHRLELYPLGNGEVRLFGVAMDRHLPGIIVDVLGINGHRAENQLKWHEGLQIEHLRRRKPDLIALAYGTNEVGDEGAPIELYAEQLDLVLQRLKRAVPGASCLLIGPSDRPAQVRRRYEVRARQGEIIQAQRQAARRHGCAFFDLVAFMGGPGSMVDWVRADPPLGAPDHVHFTSLGYERMGTALYDALLQTYEQ